MYIENHSLDELLSIARLSDVISSVTKLKKNGNEFTGLCPFHKEKTPSFSVNDSKGLYYCFGCKESGNILKFVQEYYGMNFIDAAKFIADKYAFDLKFQQQKEQDSEQLSYYEKLKQILSEAAKLFELELSKNQNAQNYVNSRQIDFEIQTKFRLGYAPDHGKFIANSLKNYDKNLLIDSGLVLENDSGKLYDRFRGRLMFPIFNVKEEIIAFGGRNISGRENVAKYVNSPSTAIFKKGHELYALNFAEKTARKNKRLIITEGYMDVIGLHKGGFTEAVANLGTAITEEHLMKMWKICPEPIICLDGDEAGMRAMSKLTEKALPILKTGFSLNFVILPKNTDPDDIISYHGSGAFEKILLNRKSLSEMIWHFQTFNKNFNSPEQKAMLKKRLFDLANFVPDKNLRFSYISFFNQKIRDKFSNFKKKQINQHYISSDIKVTQNYTIKPKVKYLCALLTLVIEYKNLFQDNDIIDFLIRADFASFEHENKEFARINQLKNMILELHEKYGAQDIDLKQFLKDQFFEKELALLCGKNSPFLDQFSLKNNAHNKIMWDILAKKYEIESIREEREQQLHKLTERSNNIAENLQNRILEIENEINDLQENLQENNNYIINSNGN